MVVSWEVAGVDSLTVGAPIWYKIVTPKAPEGDWKLGQLVGLIGDEEFEVKPPIGKTCVVPRRRCEAANPAMLDGVPDLTALSYLNEPSILHDLDCRYEDDIIYTTAGPVLIALNPCKEVPLYSPEMVAEYRGVRSDLEAQQHAPHIFLNAGKAYRDMVDNNASQSMVISGESGAGKTETTKKVMQFFAQMSGGTGIEDQVLQTNPLLEAFGNAKTLRNNNSSRFGKLLEIHFNKSNHICGAQISTYLLEKSRISTQIEGERSFHIFYQMIRGATAAERAAWGLAPRVEDYAYLNRLGAVNTIPGVNDAADFAEVRAAMSSVGIDADMQHKVFTVVSAILWLGNVTMRPDGDDHTEVIVDDALHTVCRLLGVDEGKLVFALTHKLVIMQKQTLETSLSYTKAVDARDALAKVLYASLFAFIVAQINDKLATEKKLSGKFIAILDIYGFESFERNHFEQLCINYANERLQQQFNKHLFKLEQEEYENEGIDWSHVEFIDNQLCLDAIEAKPPKGLGVLAVLDDQCNFPRSTDQTFSDTIRARLDKTPCFSYRPGPHIDFIIEHYAGPVTYDSTGILDKNRDTVSQDLVTLLEGSSMWLVQQLLPYVRMGLEGKGKQTVASRFKEQLLELVTRLDATQMHFVRCIKPNFSLKPKVFDQGMILQQLRCCGVLEVVRIAKAGYPSRYLHETFAERYRVLLPPSQAPTGGRKGKSNSLEVCNALLTQFRVPETMWQVGHTKIFFRAGVLGQMEDLWRRIQRGTLVIQKNLRMWRERRVFVAQRRAASIIAAHWRGLKQRRQYRHDLRRHRAAIVIQTAERGRQARVLRRRRWAAIVAVQCAFRWREVRRRVAAREKDMREQLHFARVAQAAALEEMVKIQERESAIMLDLRAAKQAAVEWQAIQADLHVDGPAIRASVETMIDLQRDFEIDVPTIRANLETWQTIQRALNVDSATVCASVEALQALERDFGLDAAGVRAAVEVLHGLKRDFELDPPALRAFVAGWAGLAKDLEMEPQDVRDELERSREPSMAAAAPGMDAEELDDWLAHRDEFLEWKKSGGAARAAGGGLRAAMYAGTKDLAPSTGALSAGPSADLSRGDDDEAALARDLGSDSGDRDHLASKERKLYQQMKMQLQDEMEQRIQLQKELARLQEAAPSNGRGASAGGNGQVQTIVNKVKREFGDKVNVMNDDLRFIQEVAKGETLAPDMDCMEEVHALKNRFDTWKTSFKQRMQQTYVLVKHHAKHRGRTRITGPVLEGETAAFSPTAADFEDFGSPRSPHAAGPFLWDDSEGATQQRRIMDSVKLGLAGAGRLASRVKGRVQSTVSATIENVRQRRDSFSGRARPPG